MPTRVLFRHEVEIRAEADVSRAWRKVRDVAQRRGFDPYATAAVTTASSELGRNVWLHGGGGSLELEEVARDGRVGLRIQFRDDGPGIADVDRMLQGGHSTIRSLGLGLAGSRRLVDEFRVDSQPGRGTTVTITKWKRER